MERARRTTRRRGRSQSSGTRGRVAPLACASMLALAAACGGADAGPRLAPVKLGLFDEPATPAEIVAFRTARTDPGLLIEELAPAAAIEDERVRASGATLTPIGDDGVRIEAAGEEGEAAESSATASLRWRPRERLPSTFRVLVALAEGSRGPLPFRLQWAGEEHPDFHKWRSSAAEYDGEDRSRATYVVHAPREHVRELRFDFRSLRSVELADISIRTQPLGEVELAEDARFHADLGGVTLPARWTQAPSELRETLVVPPHATLELSVGLSVDSAVRGAGARLRVLDGASGDVLASHDLRARDGRPAWRELAIDLARYSGRELDLRLAAEPLDAAAEAPVLAFWGAPRVTANRRAPEPRVIVLAVLDTTRRDALSVYGHDVPTTPFLEELGERAVVFESAYSQSPWTVPSVASILTSRTPSALDIHWGERHEIAQRFSTAAELLSEAGFSTAAFIGNPVLAAARGYAQGFDHYECSQDAMLDGAEVTDRALAWLDRHHEERSFLYVHYVDPHTPYERREKELRALHPAADVDELLSAPLPPRDADEAREVYKLYEAEIRALDAELRRLHDGVREHVSGSDFLMVVAADHGEEFLDHGFWSHGSNVHASQVQVPLLVAWPGVLEPARVDATVSNLDILPSLLDAVRASAPESLEGASLLGAESRAAPRTVISETESHGPRRVGVREGVFAYLAFDRGDPFYVAPARCDESVVRALEQLPAEALYRTGPDEPELTDASAAHPDVLRRLRRRADAFEIARQQGYVLRWRGAVRAGAGDGASGAAARVRGEIRLHGGTFEGLRARAAEPEQDRFTLDEARTTLSFDLGAAAHDEEWLFFRVSAPDTGDRVVLESEHAVVLGAGEAAAAREIALDAPALRAAPADVLAALDAAPDEPLVHLWWHDAAGGAAEATVDAREIFQLQNLGYVGGGDEE